MTSHQKYGLLDTSTVILLGEVENLASLPDHSLISSITLAELSVGPLLATTDQERLVRQTHLQQAESDFEPIPFGISAARVFPQVSLSLRSAGRKSAARSYDALIASVAIAEGLPLYTCNPTDFQGITGLDLRPVPHPSKR